MPGEERSTPLPVQNNDDPASMNQVSYSLISNPVMKLPWHSPRNKVPFKWSKELKSALQTSEEEIACQCASGARMVNPDLLTCLATDWSKSKIKPQLGLPWSTWRDHPYLGSALMKELRNKGKTKRRAPGEHYQGGRPPG